MLTAAMPTSLTAHWPRACTLEAKPTALPSAMRQSEASRRRPGGREEVESFLREARAQQRIDDAEDEGRLRHARKRGGKDKETGMIKQVITSPYFLAVFMLLIIGRLVYQGVALHGKIKAHRQRPKDEHPGHQYESREEHLAAMRAGM